MQNHDFHPTSLREYDIRGIIGETLGDQDAHAIGRGFGTVVRRAGGDKVCVGYDGRHSSPRLERALVEGLMATGCEVIRIGLGSTGMLYFSVSELGADGGVMITGSHNPPDYNGFKMLLKDRPFFGADIRALGVSATAGDWEQGEGRSREVRLLERYVERLQEDNRCKPFRIGWDAGNGATGEALELLLKTLPGEHHALFTKIDGDFPNHHPDPTVEANLEDLRQLVSELKLDFGIAFDGDGDRIGAIDGEGRVVWGDQLLAILAEPVLKEVPGGTIIADVKASQALYDRVAELGGKPLMWKTGHSLIKAKMKEVDSPLAGEMSGHIFFKHRWYGFDDALYAAIRLIEAVGELGGSLTALKSAMPPVLNTPEMRFPCSEERKFLVVEEVLARLKASGAEVNDTDGARVNTADGWWLLRASNTQDVLVARAEAKDAAALERLKAEIDSQLKLSGVERVEVGH
jgi:phosphomannomutase